MTRNVWVPAGALALVALAVVGGVVVASGGKPVAAGVGLPPGGTAPVERGRLADAVSGYGTLTYRARPDGSPYAVVDRAAGTYTELPAVGDRVGCGGVLYRVNDEPVLLLCGPIPAYRSLAEGASGRDVAELNAGLVRLGLAARAQLDPASAAFGPATAAALERLQARLGEAATGSLPLGRAVFLPEPVRIAGVSGRLAAPARPGATVLTATSDVLEVQLSLDPSQQGAVRVGDRALVTLPGNETVKGEVSRLGEVVQVAAAQGGGPGSATIPVSIGLDRPAQARGLDQAPVQVQITTRGVASALNVPVTAIVGRSGGGFAVETVAGGGQRRLVPVTLGLFDTAAGRVQVEGRLRAGDRVVVPAP